MCLQRPGAIITSLFILLANAPSANAIIWDQCFAKVQQLMQNDASIISNPQYSQPGSTYANPKLTLYGCEAFCGSQRNFYADWGNILNSWLLPAIVLISQLNLRNRKALLDTPHLLGDPIDWVFCNLVRMEVASRSWKREEQLWELANQLHNPHVAEGLELQEFTRILVIENAQCCGMSCPNGQNDAQQTADSASSSIASSEAIFTTEVSVEEHEDIHKSNTPKENTPVSVSEIPVNDPAAPVTTTIDLTLRGNKADCVRIRGSVFMYLEMLRGDGGPQYDFWDELIQKTSDKPLCPKCQKSLMVELAHSLSNGRAWHLANALVALTLYAWQAISSFSTVVGGSWSTVPGGRIGLAMYYHFLIPAVLLSSVLGSFPSPTFCYRTMDTVAAKYGCDFESALKAMKQKDNHNRNSSIRLIEPSTPWWQRWRLQWSHQVAITQRDSGNGVYRRRTSMKSSGSRSCWPFRGDTPPWALYVFSALPVLIACTNSLPLFYFLPPHGMNPRLVLVLTITGFFLISATITAATRHASWLLDRTHMFITLAKDIMIGIPSLILVAVASCGAFNSCYWWSGVWRLGHLKAFISLNSEATFEPNLRVRYPILFSACIAGQLLSFLLMLLNGRRGLRLIRWSESTRKRILALLDSP